MELYSTKYKQFIDIATSTSFSIEADNQFQDLENYTVCQSYDLQLVSNAVNNVVCRDNSQILLYHNGSPILCGRFVYRGSSTDTIKVVFQALPYGPAFRNFVFRDKLKDYFLNSDSYLGELKCSYLLYQLYQTTGDDSLIIMRAKRNIVANTPYTADVKYFNHTSHSASETSHNPRNNHRSSIWMSHKIFPFISDDSHDYEPWLAKVRVWDLLKCMGIDSEYDDWNTQDYIYFPMKIKYEKKFKVTMYQKSVDITGGIWGANTRYVFYAANKTSEIDEWDESNNCWLHDSDSALQDTSAPVTFIGAFQNTIRENKAMKDLELVEILYKFDNAIDSLQIMSTKLNNELVFNAREGQTFEEGDSIAPCIICDKSAVDVCPQKIDVVFKVTVDVDPQKYAKDKDSLMYTPFNTLDVSFLDMKTNDFLNMLSLNGKRYTWLRNPLYMTIDNHEMVWGKEGGQMQYSLLTDADIVSMEKEVDTDAASTLRVQMPSYEHSSASKYLNDLGNDEKLISPTLVSYCFQNTSDSTDDAIQSFPPIFYDSDKDLGEQILEDDIEGIIGYETTGNVYDSFKGKFKYTCYNFFSDSTDLDYIDYYQDHSEKYKVKCVGYKLTEDVKINGVAFSVVSWKTDDFVYFELELYKTKED